MSNGDQELRIPLGRIRAETQVALLGAIGPQILGVCIEFDHGNLKMVISSDGYLSDNEREEFDVATTELIASFGGKVLVTAKFVENAQIPLQKCSGIWVFVRYGCQVEA